MQSAFVSLWKIGGALRSRRKEGTQSYEIAKKCISVCCRRVGVGCGCMFADRGHQQDCFYRSRSADRVISWPLGFKPEGARQGIPVVAGVDPGKWPAESSNGGALGKCAPFAESRNHQWPLEIRFSQRRGRRQERYGFRWHVDRQHAVGHHRGARRHYLDVDRRKSAVLEGKRNAKMGETYRTVQWKRSVRMDDEQIRRQDRLESGEGQPRDARPRPRADQRSEIPG